MVEAFARRTTTMVHNADVPMLHHSALPCEPQGQVVILKIQEVGLVKTPDFIKNSASHPHAAAGGQFNGSQRRLTRRVSHLVARQRTTPLNF